VIRRYGFIIENLLSRDVCREHSQMGKTLAEQAGLKLDLQPNKVESLALSKITRPTVGAAPACYCRRYYYSVSFFEVPDT
jgi:hypothetical protein